MANRNLYFPRLTRRSTYSQFTHYREYKYEIREDCQGRCVYCDIHENEIGGIEFMTIDHFRPQKLYRNRQHDPLNLLWCCLQCNQNKGQYWPAIGTPNTYVNRGGFVDPFEVDIWQYFDVGDDGKLVPLQHPARYMIKTLKLNRDSASRRRKKRRVEFESRQAPIKTLRRLIRETDDALEDENLTDLQRSMFSTHKEALSKVYNEMIADAKPDFALR